MTVFSDIKTCFDDSLARFEKGRAISTLLAGQATAEQYCAILRQIYFQARENPQIQAFATAYFRGDQRNSVRRFLQHATAEIGHDQLALNDLKALGQDVSALPTMNPASATIALTSFAYFQATHLNPVGYLGYLFFLEFMPTSAGEQYCAELGKSGVPQEAMSFLLEHAHVDVAHNRLMEKYITTLVQTQADIDSVKYAIRVTGDLYGRMLEQAMFADETVAYWGAASEEQAQLAPAVATA
ncbi:MAG: iron-containing redox enzyme family protein [Gammaproteobacteria bacterium]